MLLAILQRLAQMVFVMFGISALVFLIFFATPGADPAARIAGRNAAQETVEAIRKDFGFDRPLPVQYARMMTRLFVTQDLTSFVNRGLKVVPQVLSAAPVTLSLVIGAAILWVIGGIFVGVVAALTRDTFIDKGLMVLALIGVSMPVFWFGEVMNLVSQSRFHDTWLFSWVPGLGYKPLLTDPWGWFKTLIIPWFTLAALYIGIYGRVLRATLVEAYQEDFIRTARAKGLSPSRVMLRHALRTSLIPFVTMFGLDFGVLVGGAALLTEVVFGLNGIGRLTYQALLNLDLPMILATVMYASFFVVIANALVDVVYVLIDPRVRAR
ncbi:Glutathione transport system permease protein GsiC [Hartmannibacter diazotrophicus]|uniref:Glutathione transport system permease protein GsiC n=1 Tax=Hartmannibacter diazotrophicus TaxID=1482074 RepID=A0A2C9D0K3_9HYPH|nr:ABC transporter permease [Hartmannibacter diazotrophicus]SON53764.1 Glutathione transport system permease protein GsiC [Hartmannibacter diazotrophicus]